MSALDEGECRAGRFTRVAVAYEAGWSREPVLTLCQREKCMASAAIEPRSLCRSDRSEVRNLTGCASRIL